MGNAYSHSGLAKLGKDLHTVDRGQLKTDFASLLIAMLDAKSAGEERRKIIERTSRGRNGKAKAGRVVGSGYAPFGYKFTTERVLNPKTGQYREVVTGLEVLPAEAETVKLIYTWYALGDDDAGPMTAGAIARKLSEMGVSAPGAGKKRSRGDTIWNFNSVLRILDVETYAAFGDMGGKSAEARTAQGAAYRGTDSRHHPRDCRPQDLGNGTGAALAQQGGIVTQPGQA